MVPGKHGGTSMGLHEKGKPKIIHYSEPVRNGNADDSVETVLCLGPNWEAPGALAGRFA